MASLLDFTTKNGDRVLFDIGSAVPEEGSSRENAEGLMSARGGDLIVKASQSYEEALATIKSGIELMSASVQGVASSADEVVLEFGIKVGAKYGMCISGSADANISVKLTFKHAK